MNGGVVARNFQGGSIKFGAPKSNVDACAPPPPRQKRKNGGSVPYIDIVDLDC